LASFNASPFAVVLGAMPRASSSSFDRSDDFADDGVMETASDASEAKRWVTADDAMPFARSTRMERADARSGVARAGL